MISTVTTSTVSTVTTATIAITAGLSLFAVLTLLNILITKEIISVSDNPAMQKLGRVMNIGLVPLALSFVFIAIVNIADYLN